MGWRVAVVSLLASGLGHRSGIPVGPEGPRSDRCSLAKESADAPADPRLHPARGGGDRQRRRPARHFSMPRLGGLAYNPRGAASNAPTSASIAAATFAPSATVAPWTRLLPCPEAPPFWLRGVGPGDPVIPAVLDEFRLLDLPLPAGPCVLAGFLAMLYQRLDPFRMAPEVFRLRLPSWQLAGAGLGPAESGLGLGPLLPALRQRRQTGFDALLGLNHPVQVVAGCCLVQAVGTAGGRRCRSAGGIPRPPALVVGACLGTLGWQQLCLVLFDLTPHTLVVRRWWPFLAALTPYTRSRRSC